MQTFCKTCVHYEHAHSSIHMTRRFVIQGFPTLIGFGLDLSVTASYFLYRRFIELSVLFHHTVVEVGFVDTLVEVNETDGQATLNVSIIRTLPDLVRKFEIMFRLSVDSVDGSAGMDVIPNFL